MIRERIVELWDAKGLSARDLEQLTGLDRDKWYSLRNGRRRTNEDDLTALVAAFPNYAYWLISGNIAPEAGQVSPSYEEANEKLLAPNAG